METMGELELGLEATRMIVEVSSYVETCVHNRLVPAVVDARDAIDAFLAGHMGNAFAGEVDAVLDTLLESLNGTRNPDLLMSIQDGRRRRRMQEGDRQALDQVSRLAQGMDGFNEKAEWLASKAEVAIVPLINTAMTQIDKITAFLQSTIASMARKAHAQLPMLRDKLDTFMVYFRMFVGMVQDLLATAKKAVAGSPELTQIADTIEGYLNMVMPFAETWLDKVEGWIDTAEGIIVMGEEMDAEMLFDLIAQLLERLNLPGEKIMKGIAEVTKMLGIMCEIVNDPNGGSSAAKITELGEVLMISVDHIEPGASDAILDEVNSAIEGAASAIDSAASAAVPEELFDVFIDTHDSLCDDEARARVLCSEFDPEKTSGISGLFARATEIKF